MGIILPLLLIALVHVSCGDDDDGGVPTGGTGGPGVSVGDDRVGIQVTAVSAADPSKPVTVSPLPIDLGSVATP